jgi:methyl-accepting chemotaxis protein
LSKQYSDAVIQASITQNIGLAGDDSYPILFDKNHLRLADGFGPTRLYKTLVPLDATTAAALQEKHLLPFGSPLNFSSNLPDFEEKLNQIESQPFFAADLHDNDLDVEQVATATLKTQPWIVVFAQSQDVFLTPINVQARNNVLGMVVMSLMVAGFGFFVSQTVAGPIVRLTKAVESIHEGNLEQSAAVESQDEIGKLALAFNDMTLQLRGFINLLEQRVVERTAVAENARAESEAARRDLELQMWLATGQTQLMDVMRGEQTLPQLAGNVITQICQYTGAQAGAIFILKDKTLTLAGRYAYAERPGMEDGFQLGDGLVGQAAADGKVIYWDVIPPDALVISTGLVNIKPRQLAAAPFFMNEKVVGVLELATLSTFTPAHLELWNRISESLGTAFVTVQTRQRLAELLMESQQQAEELQAQEEELRAANEELQAQAENLKAIRPARAKR